jgi:hypothetical protein
MANVLSISSFPDVGREGRPLSIPQAETLAGWLLIKRATGAETRVGGYFSELLATNNVQQRQE